MWSRLLQVAKRAQTFEYHILEITDMWKGERERERERARAYKKGVWMLNVKQIVVVNILLIRRKITITT